MTFLKRKNALILTWTVAAILALSAAALTSSTPPLAMAQTADQSASTDSVVTGNVLPCNTSAPTRAGQVLTVDGINGPNGSPCVFEIKNFSFGVENPTTIGSATGGAGAGKIKFNEFTITKTTDSASPVFFKNLATGAHYKNVKLEMRKAGGDPRTTGQPFLTYTFGTVFTTKINWSGPGDEGPEESITFVYGTLGVEYKQQKPDGTIVADITSCFDVLRNAIC
jgi:type VI secretion system secreted protein Hcp